MIRRYLREHLPLAGLLALFAGTFALVLSLYHLPTEPVAYASALCAVMGLIALIWGFVRYRRAHQARAHVLNAPHLLLDELPSPRTLSEADDQAIMQRLLHDVRAAQSDLAAYRQDSTDYSTAWVHQIKNAAVSDAPAIAERGHAGEPRHAGRTVPNGAVRHDGVKLRAVGQSDERPCADACAA